MVNLLRARWRTDRLGSNMQRDEQKCTTPTGSNIVLCTHVIESTKVVWWSPSSSLAASSHSDAIIPADGLNTGPTTLHSISTSAGPIAAASGSTRSIQHDAQPSSNISPSGPFLSTPPPSHVHSLPLKTSPFSLPGSIQRLPSPTIITTSRSYDTDPGSISPPSSITSITTPPYVSTSVSESPQPSQSRLADTTQDFTHASYIPWAALGAIVASVIVAAFLLNLLWPRIKRSIHCLGGTRNNVIPTAIGDSSSQAIGVDTCDETPQTCQLVSTQSPVSIEIEMGVSDIVSSRATRGSARSMSMHSHHTGIVETSRDAALRSIVPLPIMPSIRPLPVPPARNPEISQRESSVEESSHVVPIAPDLPDAGVAINGDPGAEERDPERGQEEETVAGHTVEQDRRSTAFHRPGNMSISSGSVLTIMTEPPPPYSPDGEPFNPEEFDLSRIVPPQAYID